MVNISVINAFDQLDSIAPEWAELHRTAAPGTPFEHPGWALPWARRFVAESDLHCVEVRATDGTLVGFAPMYFQRRSAGPIAVCCLRPFGTGQQHALTEVVQVLAVADRTQDVLRAIVAHLESVEGWNWAQLSLSYRQGWLLPQWLQNYGDAIIVQRNSRPCVYFGDLPSDAATLKSDLKRNVKESIRRSRNRSAKRGGMTFRCASGADDVTVAVHALIGLHGMRSRMAGKVAHNDVFAGPEAQFLPEAAREMASNGLARVHLAEHNGDPVAALLVLSDGTTDYISSTGLNPEYWDLSLNTLLIFNALEYAAENGRSAVNLSTGPDIAKMRWSTDVVTYHDFDIVRQDRRSQALYNAFSHAAMARSTRAESRRHRSAEAKE